MQKGKEAEYKVNQSKKGDEKVIQRPEPEVKNIFTEIKGCTIQKNAEKV